jgi:hypothetical protein
MPQQSSSVGVNYNRVTAPWSKFGTRNTQIYTIRVYGVSDADSLWTVEQQAAIVYDDFVLACAQSGITIETIDTYNYQARFPTNTIYSGILNGVGDVAELYACGHFDRAHNDADDNDLTLTVFVSADTFIDGSNYDFEFWHSQGMIDAIFNRIQHFNWNDIDVTRVDLLGTSWVNSYDPKSGQSSGTNAFRGPVEAVRRSKSEIKTALAQKRR